MKLGVDVFSLRFNDWSTFDHLDYAQRIGLEVVMFPDPDFFASLDDDYLHRVKAHADGLGLELEVGMYSICESSTSFSNRRGTAAEQLSMVACCPERGNRLRHFHRAGVRLHLPRDAVAGHGRRSVGNHR